MFLDYIYKLGCSGSDGFVIDPLWIMEQKRAGLVCPKCEWIQDGRKKEFGDIVVTDMPRNVHFGRIFNFAGGIVVSRKLIKIIGDREVTKWNLCLPICNTGDAAQNGQYMYVIANKELGCLRGSNRTKPDLCSKCGRLLYWPLDIQYMLKAYWPSRGNFRIIDASGYIDAEIYEKNIKKLKLNRLTAKKIDLFDHPVDGLPAAYDSLIEELRERRNKRGGKKRDRSGSV